MSNKSRRFYTGHTEDLYKRVIEHKNKLVPGFTSRYVFDRLVFYEEYASRHSAFCRERQIKGWTRAKKIALIESVNPWWHDLSAEWGTSFLPASAKPE